MPPCMGEGVLGCAILHRGVLAYPSLHGRGDVGVCHPVRGGVLGCAILH